MTFISASSSRPEEDVHSTFGLPARLKLRSATERGGFVDGGWWPRSLDLGFELPTLLSEMFAFGYQVHRVSYNMNHWHSPAKLKVDGREIRLGGFRNQSRHSISLLDNTSDAAVVSWLEIVVIPPDTEPDVAERALELAGRDGYRFRAPEILQQAKTLSSARTT